MEKPENRREETEKGEKESLLSLTNRLDELLGWLKEVEKESQENLKAILRETEKTRTPVQDGFSDVTQSLSKISQTLSQLSEKAEVEVKLIDELSGKLLKDIPLSIESSSQKLGKEVSGASNSLNELLAHNRELGDKAFASLEEIGRKLDLLKESTSESIQSLSADLKALASDERDSLEAALSKVSGLFKEESKLVGAVDKRLSEAVSGIQGFLTLEKERNEKLDEVVRGIADSLRQMGEFLKEERDRREEERVTEKLRRAREHNDRGVSLYYRGALEAAVREFEKATELNPDQAESYNNLALSYSGLDRAEEAISNFSRAIELNPDFAEAYSNLGLIYYKRADYEEAVDLFNQALQRNERYALAYLNLGNALYQQKRYDEATKSWEKAIELDPSCEEAKKAIQLVKEGRTNG